MTEGFVVSDKNRRAVFSGILHGERELDRIVRKHRLIRRAAERALADLKEQGLVEEGEEGLRLSPQGEKTANDLRRAELIE